MLKNKTPYYDPGVQAYEAKQNAYRLKQLRRQAARLGMKLEPIAAA